MRVLLSDVASALSAGTRCLRALLLTRVGTVCLAAAWQYERLQSIPGPYWVPPAKRVSPHAFLLKLAAAQDGASEPPSRAELAALNTPMNRLKWMLIETMTAVGEEERRRSELAHLANVPRDSVTDEEVVNSFVDSVDEGGFMREYLENAQLVKRINSTLYVHGGVCGRYVNGEIDCVGVIPGRKERIKDVNECALPTSKRSITLLTFRDESVPHRNKDNRPCTVADTWGALAACCMFRDFGLERVGRGTGTRVDRAANMGQ